MLFRLLITIGLLFLKKPKGLLCVFLLGYTIYTSSQQFNFREYAYALPQPFVYSIIQDTQGYLWIGTGNGLSRFDGLNFKTFTTSDSLADNFITCIFKNESNIWFGHLNGTVSYYNGKVFHQVKAVNKNSGITDIEKSPKGKIWASTFTNGLVKLDDKLNIHKNGDDADQITILSFQFITENEILIGSLNGLNYCRINESGKIELIRHINEIPESRIQNIIKMRNGSGFYIATENNGIFQLESAGKQFKVLQVRTTVKLEFSGIQSVFEDSRSNIWISTFGNGLIKLIHSSTGQFNEATYFNKTTGFLTDYIKTVYEDREGNIWSGNYGAGLTLITGNTFSFYSYDKERYGNDIYSIFIHNNIRWLGTEKGLLKLDHSTGKILNFYSSDYGLPNDIITAIFSNNGNELWIGTGRNGIYRMIVDSENIQYYKIGVGILENSITTITGKNDQVWVGTKKGVCNINVVSGNIRSYTIDQGGLPHNYINHIFIGLNGKIWVSTIGNTLAFIKDGKVEKEIINSEKGISSLGPIDGENNSTIWVGSDGSGIFRIKPDSITNLTSDNGLISDYCYSLVADNNKNIWVSHRGGLSKIRTTDLFVKPIQQQAGIKNTCMFNTNAVFKDNNNRIWFGSNEGLLVYDPALENQVLLPPVLNIISIKVNDELVGYDKKLILPPGNYKIKFEFFGINLKEPALVNYKYQLEGYDQSPEYTRMTSISYPHLNDGKYTFNLWAYTGDGVITKDPLTIKIIIKTPIWKRWWFYIIVFLSLAFAAILYIKRREYKYIREKRNLEEKVQERTLELEKKNSLLHEIQKEVTNQNFELEKYRNYLEDIVNERTKALLIAKTKAEESERLKTSFLNNISHEIRTPLNAICGFSELLDEKPLTKEARLQYIKIINNSAQSLLFLINEILDISLLETDQIIFSNEKFYVDDVLIDLENHYKLNNNKKIEFKFINKDLNNGLELYCDKIRFRQIFINLLNNAFKYTESGYINFGYEVSEKSARFFVSDTGIGIDKSEIDKIFDPFYKIEDKPDRLYGGVGVGLATYKKIVELMGGEIWVESVVNKGSVFYFSLPVTTENTKSNIQGKKAVFKKDFLKNITILVAEDDADNYELVNGILKRYGAKIIRVHNEQEAINFIKNDPDIENCIILMDIKMPFIYGFEASRQIKAINGKIPIIALTAYAQMVDKQKIMNVIFDDYISKPISTESLLTVVSKFLEKNK